MYLFNLLIALDQLGNSILGGYPDETISARLWRNREKHPFVNIARQLVDALFYIGFGQLKHCQHAHEWEVKHGIYQRLTGSKNVTTSR